MVFKRIRRVEGSAYQQEKPVSSERGELKRMKRSTTIRNYYATSSTEILDFVRKLVEK